MNSFLIDTHAHLDFGHYDSDRNDVIWRAQHAGVKAIITIGIDLDTSRASIKIAEEHKNIFAAIGIHPHDAQQATLTDIEQLESLLEHPKVVAIGEVGLDYYRNSSPMDIQRKIFRLFLDLSLTKGYPLIIHTRDADEDIQKMIWEKSRTGWRGVFHCFSGDEKMAERVMEMGFHISFTGNITFKNSRSIDVLKSVPVEKLLLETDSPFMAPVPHRGKRNEPAFVNQVAQKIAEVKGLDIKELADATSQNAIHLFGLAFEAEEE